MSNYNIIFLFYPKNLHCRRKCCDSNVSRHVKIHTQKYDTTMTNNHKIAPMRISVNESFSSNTNKQKTFIKPRVHQYAHGHRYSDGKQYTKSGQDYNPNPPVGFGASVIETHRWCFGFDLDKLVFVSLGYLFILDVKYYTIS